MSKNRNQKKKKIRKKFSSFEEIYDEYEWGHFRIDFGPIHIKPKKLKVVWTQLAEDIITQSFGNDISAQDILVNSILHKD